MGADNHGPAADAGIHRFLERIEARRLHDGKRLELADIGDAHHLRVRSRHGIVDVMRGGLPPLDLENLERVHGELPKDPIPGLDS